MNNEKSIKYGYYMIAFLAVMGLAFSLVITNFNPTLVNTHVTRNTIYNQVPIASLPALPSHGGLIMCKDDSLSMNGFSITLKSVYNDSGKTKAHLYMSPWFGNVYLTADGTVNIYYTSNTVNKKMLIQMWSINEYSSCVEMKYDVQPKYACTDTDGGLNYYKAGTTKGVLYTTGVYNGYQDACTIGKAGANTFKSDYIKEYYCNDGKVHLYYNKCPTDYTCSYGACVKKQIKPSCTDYDGYNYYTASKIVYTDDSDTNKPLADVCLSNTKLEERICNGNNPSYTYVYAPSGYECKNGAFVKKETTQTPSCTDYDGHSYYTASKIVYTDDSDTNKPLADVCLSNTKLEERICNGNNPSYTYVYAPSGYECKNGAFVKKEMTSTCNDFDGLNYYKESYTYSTDKAGKSVYLWDSCYSSNVLKERTCSGGIPTYKYYTCPSDDTCSYGACVKKSSTINPSCTDTDGGYNIYKKGKAYGIYKNSAGNTVYYGSTDYCIGNKLKEYYCSGALSESYEASAPSGYECEDGAFVKKSNEAPPNPPTNSNYQYTIKLYRGWNMISSPVGQSDTATFYGKITENTCQNDNGWFYLAYNKKYSPYNFGNGVIETPRGYWLKEPSSCEITVVGTDTYNYDINNYKLYKGWNLINGPYTPTSWNNVKGTCSLTSGPWYYDGSTWVKSTTLKSGEGYFVKVANDCKLSSSITLPLPPE